MIILSESAFSRPAWNGMWCVLEKDHGSWWWEEAFVHVISLWDVADKITKGIEQYHQQADLDFKGSKSFALGDPLQLHPGSFDRFYFSPA